MDLSSSVVVVHRRTKRAGGEARIPVSYVDNAPGFSPFPLRWDSVSLLAWPR